MREGELFFARLMTLPQRGCNTPSGARESNQSIRQSGRPTLVGTVLYGDFLELHYLLLTAMITPPATIRLPPRKMGSAGI
jgi:hypothetical protein